MKPQKCVFKKCIFNYSITGKLRLTTTFRRCRCIFLAPPPRVRVNTVPSEVQLLQTTEGWKGVGVVGLSSQRSWRERERIENGISLANAACCQYATQPPPYLPSSSTDLLCTVAR